MSRCRASLAWCWMLVLPAASLLVAPPASAITVAGFSPAGSVLPGSGDGVSLGSGAEVFQLESFVQLAGSSTSLSSGAVPGGFDLAFSSTLADGDTDLVLTWDLRNDTGAAISGLSFVTFLDAEIDEPLNGFFNEVAAMSGSLAAGQSFEADEPGYTFGDIFFNALAGSLDGTNTVGAPEDVALALGFEIGLLDAGEIARFRIMLSEDSDQLGTFALVQSDADPRSSDVITFSGSAEVISRSVNPIPEPSAALLFSIGLIVTGLAPRRRSAARD